MPTVKEKGFSFDIRQTNICKGVAVLILVFHHMFRYSPVDFVPLIKINDLSLAYRVADFGHVCVAVFLILSGYGLYKSYCSFERKNGGKLSIKLNLLFVKNHLLKLMLSFWFIYLLFVPLGFLFGRSPVEIYQGNLLYALFDFLGIAYWTGTPLFNQTWWFMSVIILYYLLFPVMMKLLRLAPELLLAIGLFINFAQFIPNTAEARSHFLPFILGIYLSQGDLLNKSANRLNSVWKALLSSLLLIGAGVLFRHYFNNSIALDAMFGLGIMMFSSLLLSRIPVLRKILEELGKTSSAIFMFHSFIYVYYHSCRDVIYWFRYVPLIFSVMMAVCYGIAKLIDLLKRLIRFDKLVDLCTGKKRAKA
ncbi:MAG: acyltransferase [Ruminococcus sp.]|nr:acyltransferase [Ruminococcus sp.]